MALPYSSATSGGPAAREEIRKILTAFGCSGFATAENMETGDVKISFIHRGREVAMVMSAAGYAEALTKTPRRKGRPGSLWGNDAAMKQAQITIWSVMRDWVKSQVTIIESGVLSFEQAFLAQIVLPEHGETVLDHLTKQGALPPPDQPRRLTKGAAP